MSFEVYPGNWFQIIGAAIIVGIVISFIVWLLEKYYNKKSK